MTYDSSAGEGPLGMGFLTRGALMNAIFFDHEDPTNPLNGCRLTSTEAITALRSLQGREPFICSLEADSGALLVGIGQELGCVQFTPTGGGPPYLMATDGSITDGDEHVEFLSEPRGHPERCHMGGGVIDAANRAKAALRAANPGKYAGQQLHEIQPVKFGDNPTDPSNKVALTPGDHAGYTKFWNRLMRVCQ